MSTYTDSAGIHTTGIIYEQDLNDIANYYRQWFSVSYTSPGKVKITVDHWNALKAAIIAAVPTDGDTSYDLGKLPTFEAGIIRKSTWPSPSAMFKSSTHYYVNVGNNNVTVPGGCVCIIVNWLIGGGGGGGYGIEVENGGGGGGGGSGGWYQNLKYNVNAGDALNFVVGGGGGWGGAGGVSTIYLNGTEIAGVGGGNPGNNAGPWNGGGGGAGGAPNGNWGQNGNEAGGGAGSADGGNGGDGPFGGGGHKGYAGGGWPGGDGTEYGAGGGGGGSWDRHSPWNFHGGVGHQGYIEVQFLNATDAATH